MAGFALVVPLLLGAPALASATPLELHAQVPANCTNMNDSVCQPGNTVIGHNTHHQSTQHENASEHPHHGHK
ncbi:hypothetical protein [Saccharopolyspora oryzae]|uniref:DUF320 domain-containing protein n=1 Tax=Saccharopolyspora oryzae TaxID=2997343 RepID=A0ABT4USU4_9PSEU|nr:hypothetical protein [Saccharopolyspora oryzae]MDA3624137.1 hypothetical protein [Saccharopolyspora oryzae]